MTTTELEKRATEWAEIFFEIIPEERLRECYVAAERNPERRVEDRNFPLRRREILDAWYRITGSETKPKPVDCDFCELYFEKPEGYSPCPFHSKLKDLIHA